MVVHVKVAGKRACAVLPDGGRSTAIILGLQFTAWRPICGFAKRSTATDRGYLLAVQNWDRTEQYQERKKAPAAQISIANLLVLDLATEFMSP